MASRNSSLEALAGVSIAVANALHESYHAVLGSAGWNGHARPKKPGMWRAILYLLIYSNFPYLASGRPILTGALRRSCVA